MLKRDIAPEGDVEAKACKTKEVDIILQRKLVDPTTGQLLYFILNLFRDILTAYVPPSHSAILSLAKNSSSSCQHRVARSLALLSISVGSSPRAGEWLEEG